MDGLGDAAALFGTVLAVIIAASTTLRYPVFKFVIPAVLALLWLVSDILFLRHAQATLWPLLSSNTNGADRHMNTGMGEHLPELAELITANTSVTEAVVTVSLDPSGDFHGSKVAPPTCPSTGCVGIPEPNQKSR